MAEDIGGPDDLLRAEVQEARALLEAGRWQEGRHRLRELAREYPGQPVVLAALGDCYSQAGRWREAVYWYERAIDQRYDPEVATRLHNAREQLAAAPPRGAAPRTVVAVALSFGVLAAVTVLLVFLSRPSRVPHRPMPVGGPAPVLQPGQPGAAQRPTAAGEPRSVVGGAPPPAAPAAPAAAPAGAPAPAAETPRPPAPAQAPAFPVRVTLKAEAPATDEDYFLTEALGTLSWPDGTPLSGGAFVQSDPVVGRAFVTITIPRALSSAGLAEAAVQAAYGAAVAVLKADPAMFYVGVRVLYALGGEAERPRTVVAFRGDTNRQVIEEWQKAGAVPGMDALWSRIFSGAWWNPDVPVSLAPSTQ